MIESRLRIRAQIRAGYYSIYNTNTTVVVVVVVLLLLDSKFKTQNSM